MKSEQEKIERLGFNYLFCISAHYNNIQNPISNWGIIVYGAEQMPKCLKLNEMNGPFRSHKQQRKEAETYSRPYSEFLAMPR